MFSINRSDNEQGTGKAADAFGAWHRRLLLATSTTKERSTLCDGSLIQA